MALSACSKHVRSTFGKSAACVSFAWKANSFARGQQVALKRVMEESRQ